MLLTAFLLTVGFFILYLGAEILIKGASGLAKRYGLSQLTVGLTLVAFGTSSPELFVSAISALEGKGMLAIGNVVGSNICNIALVLGLTSLFCPISCKEDLIKKDLPVMIAVSLYLIIICLDSEIGRFDGLILLLCLALYTRSIYKKGKKEKERLALKDVLFFASGILLVITGAKLIVSNTEELMKFLGISEKIIGLTIVAFGTSLPELATSVVAAYRRHPDISIGNLIGSNVFNIMCVLGICSLLRPICIPEGIFKSKLIVDYLIMLLISILPWIMVKKEGVFERKRGMILLSIYAVYVFYLYSF